MSEPTEAAERAEGSPEEGRDPDQQRAIGVYNQAYKTRQELEKELDDAKIGLAQEHLQHFMEYVIRDSQKNTLVKCSQIHKSWCNHIGAHLNSRYNIGILSPYGHGKSVCVAVALPLWLIGRNQNLRVGIICNSDANASKRLRSIGEYIKSSVEYQRVHPHIRPGRNKTWNDHRLEVERNVIANEGTIEAYGIDATGIGSRFDVMIYDDPVDQKDASSEATRIQRTERFNNVWSSRLEPGGKSFYIATRWHKHDLTNEVMQKANWKFIIQAVNEDCTKILEPPENYKHYSSVLRRDKPRVMSVWKEKWSTEALKDRMVGIGLRAFNRGFRQQPYGDEDTLFSEEAILDCCKWDVSVQDAVPPEWPRYLGADLAGDKRPGTVITVIARDMKSGKKRLVETRRGNWGWSARTAAIIYEMFMKHNCKVGYVENNAAQEIMLELIKTIYGSDISIKGYTTGRQKADAAEGLPGLGVEFDNRAWMFPLKHVAKYRAEIPSSEVAEIVMIRELLEYPYSSTSDSLMSLWFASHASKAGLHCMMPGIYAGEGQSRMFQGHSNYFGSGYQDKRLAGVSK